MTKPRTTQTPINDFALLVQSDDDRDVALYKKIIGMDMAARGRAGSAYRSHANKLREIARKRLAGVSWKEINFKPTVY